MLGKADRRLQRAVEPELAVRLEDDVPGFDRARHRHRVDRAVDPLHALGEQRLGRGRRAGAAAAVVTPGRLAGLRDDAEAIAADAGALRLDHAEHGAGGDSGIGGVAAVAQHIDRGQRGERMRGRGHAGRGDYRRAAGQLKIAWHEITAVAG